MKVRFALLAAAGLFVAGPAQADWTGFYAGAHAGYAWGDANQTRFSNVGGPFIFTQADADLDGGAYGFHLGGNFALGGAFIGGIEGDYGWNTASGDDGGSGGDTNEWEATSQGSIRARLGYLSSEQTLLYLTGGYTWLAADANVTNAPTSSRSHDFSGYILGAGADVMVTETLSFRLQYTYSDFEEDRVTFAPAELYDVEAGPTLHALTVGLSYHF